MNERFEPVPLTHILDTMQSWIDGEPVWPFARIIEAWGEEFENYHVRLTRQIAQAKETGVMTFRDAEGMLTRGMSLWHLRDKWVERFGFAIPCAELLDELATHTHVVEVGAGSGYMTRLMLNRGIKAMGSNPPLYDYTFEHGKWAMLVPHDAKTMVRAFPDATIFCSWPTLNHTWFRQMLKAMTISQRLVVIREGACAESSAWNYLDDCFDHLRSIDIPTFEHMNDYAGVYVKKRQRHVQRAD